MRRLILAFKCFLAILFRRRLPPEVLALTGAPPATPAKLEAPAAAATRLPEGAVEVLALLQREGRLVDFLEEDVSALPDAQVGAAVRDIHRGCRKVLGEYFAIEPILRDPENALVQIDDGFDAAAVRLVGNVAGTPPYKGHLRHHGWRTTRVALPGRSPALEPAVLAPAEVELP
jgi:hypothetical protein